MDTEASSCFGATVTIGDGFTQYRGRNFLTIAEARWAVFLAETLGPLGWQHDMAAEWVSINPRHYRPQFSLSSPGFDAYLSVQDPSDYEACGRHRPAIEEAVVYLAVGEPPDERRLGITGWWDLERHRGVTRLTTLAFEWEQWFPAESATVLHALEEARSIDFGPQIPLVRKPREGVRDIRERERERSPGGDDGDNM